MNQRNVDALTELLTGAHGFVKDSGDLAAYLAEHGVLVPQTLTNHDCIELTMAWDDGYPIGRDEQTAADEMRQELARIAKGESDA